MTTNGNTNGINEANMDGNTNENANYRMGLLIWKVGLINSARKYLTAESFGNKINASGQLLKKKQTWTLEQDTKEETVYIRSHLNRYLSADKYGKVSCETEVDDLQRCNKFAIEYGASGKFAFKNLEHGNYLGGKDDNVKCFAKAPTDEELWTVQLSIHPQINLRSVNRKRYAVLCEDEIHCKEIIPWGEEAFIVLHFIDDSGKYALKTCNNKFLHREGRLVEELSEDAQFDIEIKSGPVCGCGLAFKGRNGYYLTAVGATGTMKAGKNKVAGKDELFTIEDCAPQVAIQSVDNEKYISVKQGVDLSANQTEIEHQEIFQMEYEKSLKKWHFRTCEDKYWAMASFEGISSKTYDEGIAGQFLFDVKHVGDGTVTIMAPGDKYLFNKSTGSMYCRHTGMDESTPKSFFFRIRTVNRPFLILKCDYGYVGLKSTDSAKPEVVCNKTSYGITCLEYQPDGKYCLRAINGKYWKVGDKNMIYAEDVKPECEFLVEFLNQTELCLKAPNGKYVKGGQNTFTASGEEIDASTRWEY